MCVTLNIMEVHWSKCVRFLGLYKHNFCLESPTKQNHVRNSKYHSEKKHLIKKEGIEPIYPMIQALLAQLNQSLFDLRGHKGPAVFV